MKRNGTARENKNHLSVPLVFYAIYIYIYTRFYVIYFHSIVVDILFGKTLYFTESLFRCSVQLP